MKKTILIIGLIVGIGIVANAQTATPKTHVHQKNQIHRIQEGVQSGELTMAEAKRLTNEQRQIQAQKALAKADGKVTRLERKVIRKEQREANRHIRRQKHDAQARY